MCVQGAQRCQSLVERRDSIQQALADEVGRCRLERVTPLLKPELKSRENGCPWTAATRDAAATEGYSDHLPLPSEANCR